MTRHHVRAPPGWPCGDLLAGVTVAAYLVPQVMAYVQVAGLRPAAGLWAAAPAPVIYGVLGSSRSLSPGPEATTALMTAAAIGPLALRDELARDGTVRVKQDLLVRLKAFGLAAKIGQDWLFPTLPTAVAACQRWAAEQDQRPGEEPGGSRRPA